MTDRDTSTAALTALGYGLGARLFRVHAVRPNLQALRLAEALAAR
jgi:dihydropteroate synthase